MACGRRSPAPLVPSGLRLPLRVTQPNPGHKYANPKPGIKQRHACASFSVFLSATSASLAAFFTAFCRVWGACEWGACE